MNFKVVLGLLKITFMIANEKLFIIMLVHEKLTHGELVRVEVGAFLCYFQNKRHFSQRAGTNRHMFNVSNMLWYD